jgi:PAS domain S-box-containing protein
MPIIRSAERRAFAARLPYAQVFCVLLAFGLMTLSSYIFAAKIEQGHLINRTDDLLTSVEYRIASDLKELETMLGVVSETIRDMLCQGASYEEVTKYMADLTSWGTEKAVIPGFLSVFAMFDTDTLSGSNGYADYQWPAQAGFNGRDPDWVTLFESGNFIPGEMYWYTAANEEKGGIGITDSYEDIFTNEMAVTFARCIYGNGGERIAIICIDLSIEGIYRVAVSEHRDGPSYWVLFDNNYIVMAHPEHSYTGLPLDDIPIGSLGLADELRQGLIIAERSMVGYDGNPAIVTVRQIASGWYLSVATRTDCYYANLRRMQRFLIILGSIMAIGLSAILINIHRNRYIAQESHQSLKNIFDTLPAAIRIISIEDPEYPLLYANKAVLDMFGCETYQQVALRSTLGFMPEAQPDGRNTAAVFLDMLKQHMAVEELQCLKLNREPFFARITSINITYEDKRASLAVIEDMTAEMEYKKMTKGLEIAYKENELNLTKLNFALEAANIGIWEQEVVSDPVSPECKISWSDEFRHILGYTGENDFPGVFGSLIERLHPEDREWVPKAVAAHILDKTGTIPFNAEYRVIKKNGEYAHLHAAAKTIRDGDGNPLRAVGAIRDITETKKLIKNSESHLTRLSILLRTAKNALWDMEVLRDGSNTEYIVNWSDEFRQLLGYTYVNEFPNTLESWSDAIHPEDRSEVLDCFGRHLSDKTGGTPYEMEYRVYNKSGGLMYLRDVCATIRDKNGEPLRIIGSVMDITEQKQMEAEIRNAAAQLETALAAARSASTAKSNFLAHMSHEIRTPMNAILGAAEIQLQKDTNTPDAEEAFDTIYNSGNLLLGIINNMLDLSKIEAGKMELNPAPYDIPSVIYDTVQLNLLHYESAPVEFNLTIAENTPLYLFGDELRIKQILNNILSNAFKYTEKGTVKLEVSAETPEEAVDPNAYTDCVLVLRVRDTGQGMSEEQLGRLFEEYTRFNMNTNRTIVGTGLGMNISKRLADMMDGEISVESTPDAGTVFTVRLPQKQIGCDVCEPGLADKLRNVRFKTMSRLNRTQIVHEYMPYGRVLVVDDVESNLYVARGMLTPYGLAIETVTSGFEALEKIRNGNVYDIVFMDHMMPKMNGVQATEYIREMGYEHAIVALTANAVSGASETFLSSGFDGYISKPIDIRELNAVLNRLIRDKRPPDLIKAARKEMEQIKAAPQPAPKTVINDELAAAAVHDIENAIDVLLKFSSGSSDIGLYTTTVHGMKSSLANIGETELSGFALKLELAGKDGDLPVITAQTPVFISELESLLKKLKRTEPVGEASPAGEAFLKEKLTAIKAACEAFNMNGVNAALAELKGKAWPADVNGLLDEISVSLLRGELKKAANCAGVFLKNQR